MSDGEDRQNRAPEAYPRSLTKLERDLVSWVLPESSPGYAPVRRLLLDTYAVLGPGRRGEGELILGTAGDEPDLTAPLPPVFAYGVIETDQGMILVTVREPLEGQISIEIVSNRSETLPASFAELRRWTYSTWEPGQACPQCNRAVREVPIETTSGNQFTLVFCTHDKRIWLYEKSAGVSLLIPVTNYYNELMLHKNIRDPKIALRGNLLFERLEEYTNVDLVRAFETYNKLKARVPIEGPLHTPAEQHASGLSKLFSRFRPR